MICSICGSMSIDEPYPEEFFCNNCKIFVVPLNDFVQNTGTAVHVDEWMIYKKKRDCHEGNNK